MKPNPEFLNRSVSFWALVKYVSEQSGYTNRKTKKNPSSLKSYSAAEIKNTLIRCNIDHGCISDDEYFLASRYLTYRCDVLTSAVEPALMNREQAKACFAEVKERVNPRHRIPFNRQKGDKRHEAYLSAMVGMLAEELIGFHDLVNDAQCLAILTEGASLKGVFSRRFDGAIPSTRDPLAIWEIKEYYGTKSFGSRVADGVYETLLDGYEINAFENEFGRRISHFLFVDDHYTWWHCGKSYLCRIIDMLHTGHVDEVFFGRQVLTQWPQTLTEIRKDPLLERLARERAEDGP